MMYLPETLKWFKNAIEKDNQHIFIFPKVADQLSNCVTLSSDKYPKTREQVIFDLRNETIKKQHIENIPNKSLSENDHLWGDERSRPQLKLNSI